MSKKKATSQNTNKQIMVTTRTRSPQDAIIKFPDRSNPEATVVITPV